MTNARAPSIQDVAAAAGVSTATVSRVLNSPDLVSAETAERVRTAIQTLGYKPNLFAQGLMTRKSRVLGIALPDIHGEFYSELLRGADEEARKLRYFLLVGTEARTGEAAEAAAASGGNGGSASGFAHAMGLLDGLAVMITEPNEKLWKEAANSQLPVVVLDAEIDHPSVDSVLVDNAVGAREAMEHLLTMVPPERMFFVGGPEANYDTRRRAETFAAVLKERGAKIRPDQMAFGDYAVEWGYAWASQQHKGRTGPVIGGVSGTGGGNLTGAGVLAANDEIALGILQAAQDSGISVPGQLKIVGFDDTRVASLVRPSLSSVRVPLAEVGAAAIDTLVRRVEDPKRPSTKTRLATKLVVRESSGWERG